MPKPPYFRQAYAFSCIPACLRMVLASLDFDISEPELRNLCNCDETRTTPTNIVKAAVECGFDAYHTELTFEELEELVSQNITPIVFIRFSEDTNYSHAVLIYKISKEKLFLLDPEIGERELDIKLFTEIWSRGSTIIVEKKTQ